MIRAIAITEGRPGLINIRDLAATMPDVEIVHIADDPRQGLDFLEHHPDVTVVFQELGKPRLNGIPLAKMLPAGVQRVIISSGKDDAKDAFDLGATDYLVSPVTPERFLAALEKVREKQGIGLASPAPPQSGVRKASPDDIIMVKVDTRMVRLRLNEITHIKGEGNYVTIYTTRGKWLVYHTMKKLEDMLAGFQFIRVHKSFIVSFPHIDTIEKHTLHIRQEEIPISDSYRDAFLKFVEEHSWMI
jgi:DNA-binding LytR/AlgR family response regulator